MVTRFDPFVDVPPTGNNILSNPDLTAVSNVLQKYWKVSNNSVLEMTQQEKDSIVAAEAAALLASSRTAAKSHLDGTADVALIDKAIVEGVVSQVANPIRQWIVSFKAQVALSSSLADLKLRVATLPDMPDITFSQVKTYLKNKIDSGQLDQQ